MENPKLNLQNPSYPAHPKVNRLGYEITQPLESVKDAIQIGMGLIQDVKKAGQELRSWSNQTLSDTTALIIKWKKEFLIPKQTPDQKTCQSLLWEIAFWENEISRMIRVYFLTVSNTTTQLKRLNPPLKSHQLEPFLKSILEDRRLTLTALEPLTMIVTDLGELKRKFTPDRTRL